jgi:hypothetical protein
VARRIQDAVGEFEWWKGAKADLVPGATSDMRDTLEWRPGAKLKPYRLSAMGTEWMQAIELHSTLEQLTRASRWGELFVPQEPVAKWLGQVGLPGSLLLSMTEIALPASRAVCDDEGVAQYFEQQVYSREGGRWSVRRRTWTQQVLRHAGDYVLEDASWWPRELHAGGAILYPPDRPSELKQLSYVENMIAAGTGGTIPSPGTEEWHARVREELWTFRETLRAFRTAVDDAKDGRSQGLDSLLAGCSLSLRPSKRFAGQRWQPVWTVATLWNGLALQAMHSLSASSFHYCEVCQAPYLRRRKNAKYCSDRCNETGRKRLQRARARTAAKAVASGPPTPARNAPTPSGHRPAATPSRARATGPR